ncbi:MAG: hypothetical protein HQ474_08400 [Flammeovirgaceae bacterium]|jgi:hypothetical protein|nr:hypothetical protein [Flammeovirgaceae bacterium]|tara:strand:+ start:936 stop:1124 length:189 start_codon:yes stop_codon:yes gene_type:complete
MHENIGQGDVFGLGNVGDFSSLYYWSSMQLGNKIAWLQNFYIGFQNYSDKSGHGYVRSIRAF